jgi:hypothetical protein
MRPRIRTLKPEIWADEAVGHLDPWERLLFIGLITMADDDGRLRALTPAITGHIFPYDEIPPRRLRRWLLRLHGVHLIVFYEVDGVSYVQICGWEKHQKINKRSASGLPAPTPEANGRLL